MNLADYSILESSAESIQSLWPDFHPSLAIMLGSGWGPVSDLFQIQDSISYEKIEALGSAGVAGHAGSLSRASYQNTEILMFQGRRHWYELADVTPLMFPMFLAKKLGVHTAFLTNAAGGLRSDLKPGSVMVINDHINFMGFNPLIGPAHPIWGERFPDMTYVYTPKLIELFCEAGKQLSLDIPTGCYCAFSGPCYETPAEVQMAGTLGAAAVGMSTVPSAILARAAGIDVVALSCITNLAAGISGQPLSHQEVIEESKGAIKRIQPVIQTFFNSLFPL